MGNVDVKMTEYEHGMLRDLIKDAIYEFYDEPGGGTLDEARKQHEDLVGLAEAFGLDLHDFVNRACAYFEVGRMNFILKPTTQSWRDVDEWKLLP
jgi:hypothetical protein